MSFTKITPEDLRSRGCTTLPDQPTISAQALKEEFDAPAKEVVAPKVNNLIDELEASTAAASIGAVPPTGMTGNNIQALIEELSEGGGGTTVVANPEDEATDDLEKVKIGSTTYSIPSGGGINYSTTEQLTGRTWINGNDIYEKTVPLATLPSNTSATYPHSIGGFGIVCYYHGIKNDSNVFSDLLVDNDVTIDGTNVTLTTAKTQTGKGAITIGYTKPVGGYYPNNQYYAKDEGLICSASNFRDVSKKKTGDCYCGMMVAYNTQQQYTHWFPFILSLIEDTVTQGLDYVNSYGTITYNNQTWYYGKAATIYSYGSNIDGTTPPERRFFYGNYTGEDNVTQWLTALMNSIYG